MKGSARLFQNDRVMLRKSAKTAWFWRCIFVSAVANSVGAAADFDVQSQHVWSGVQDNIDFHGDRALTSMTAPLHREIELPEAEEKAVQRPSSAGSNRSHLAADERVLSTIKGTAFQSTVRSAAPHSATAAATVRAPLRASTPVSSSASQTTGNLNAHPLIVFPSEIPASEILRANKTFVGMVQESLRSSPVFPWVGQYVGTLGKADAVSAERLAELEALSLDGSDDSDLGYVVEHRVDAGEEKSGLDAAKTYTFINGHLHAVTPTQSAGRPMASAVLSARGSASADVPTGSVFPSPLTEQAGSPLTPAGAGRQSVPNQQQLADNKPFELPQEHVNQELNRMNAASGEAALSQSAEPDRVTVRGRVQLPSGFSKERTVLRMAGTGFQVQPDAAGVFELRDVPKNTRFEFLVWHLDGGLTRRLIPVVASGREKLVDVNLQRTSEIDLLSRSFGLTQQMNQSGFCARIENQSPTVLAGGQVSVTAGRQTFRSHYFSSNGLPDEGLSELSEDGRLCVFNIDQPLVDVKVELTNGARRQFVVHLEPSTFEHDLVFEMKEAFYRKVSLLEPIDSRQVLELAAQGVKPDFGDRRLRDWIFSSDVPVWTKVSRFLMQSDVAFSAVRPSDDDVQYFPGGQEIFELRLSPDQPGATPARVVLARDQVLTDTMLQQIARLRTHIFSDSAEPLTVPAIDSDAWEDIVSREPSVPPLKGQSLGGLYVSIDVAALGHKTKDLVVSVRDTWSGKDVCQFIPLEQSKDVQSTRFMRGVCAAPQGQYALIVENREGALLWSDIARVRVGDVHTITVLDPKF